MVPPDFNFKFSISNLKFFDRCPNDAAFSNYAANFGAMLPFRRDGAIPCDAAITLSS
jgi:hypothetical protein